MKFFYQSYLLRIWSAAQDGEPQWHASVEDPHTREVLSFQAQEDLFNFLRTLTDAAEMKKETDRED